MNLKEIAAAINAHLKRFETDKKGINAKDARGLYSYYWASCGASGRYVQVSYITYQGQTSLTKAEALHYLSMLDAGFVGRHWEAFKKSPVPKP